MTYSKMPLRTLKWPKHFGFDIVGQGPCFVLHVERGSIAYNSGLQCGDQILELDDQDVTNMSAEALKTLAKHSRSQPPTLGVVSRILHVDVVGNKSVGLGMVVSDSKPVHVWTVENNGPAHVMGIRPGYRAVIKINLLLSMYICIAHTKSKTNVSYLWTNLRCPSFQGIFKCTCGFLCTKNEIQ
jgi:S1-C subfamily serine protease